MQSKKYAYYFARVDINVLNFSLTPLWTLRRWGSRREGCRDGRHRHRGESPGSRGSVWSRREGRGGGDKALSSALGALSAVVPHMMGPTLGPRVGGVLRENPVFRRPWCSSNSIGTARGPIHTLYATCLSMIRHGSAIRHTQQECNIFADECTRDTNPVIYDPTVLDGTEVPSCELD